MSHSYKNSNEQTVGTGNKKGKVKSILKRNYRGNTKQVLRGTHTTEVPDHDTIDEIEDKVALADGKSHMEHKFIGSIDIGEKAQAYADAHDVDFEKALEVVYHRAIGK